MIRESPKPGDRYGRMAQRERRQRMTGPVSLIHLCNMISYITVNQNKVAETLMRCFREYRLLIQSLFRSRRRPYRGKVAA